MTSMVSVKKFKKHNKHEDGRATTLQRIISAKARKFENAL